MSAKADHIPKGDPCPCGYPVEYHRINSHAFKAAHDEDDYKLDECQKCGWPQRIHSKYTKSSTTSTSSTSTEREAKPKIPKVFMGIDGEGCGESPHRYVMLCVKDEHGRRDDSVEADQGLTTEQCLDFILSRPTSVRLFGYAFKYDLTKILVDLPTSHLYSLEHPEERTPERTPKNPYPKPSPVVWQINGKTYRLNLLSSRFDVSRGKRRIVIWDIFRFFGTSFVRALQDWDVGDQQSHSRILEMKEQRGLANWMSDPAAVKRTRDYCYDECHHLGALARKLQDAHDSAGLELKKYYGAGSSADAMLKFIGIKEKIVKEPEEMREPIMGAFFGGWFENSVAGEVQGPLYNIDIASAYPYQITFLPCLVHGKWTRTYDRKRIEEVRNALVRYRLGKSPKGSDLAWGPLPFRTDEGSIVYPTESGGGWVWRDEFLAAERLYPNIEFIESYLLNSDCDCQPFKQVPEWYRERLKIGKEGKGLVFKLGPNSIYGKLAQSIGANPPYQCWTWAGLTTSGTRAQLLGIMALHKNRSNVLAMATDGIISRENIILPLPRDTGTSEAKRSPKEIAKDAGKACKVCGAIACEYAHKPLGSWERKKTDAGVFFARPGIYFDLDGMDDAGKVRARGVGRKTLIKYLGHLREAWAKGQSGLLIPGDDHPRFMGMKSCVRLKTDGTYTRSANYGEWVPMPIDMSFNPLPKRSEIIHKRGQTFATLTTRKMPLDLVSEPYLGKISLERAQFIAQSESEHEQPDLPDYDAGTDPYQFDGDE